MQYQSELLAANSGKNLEHWRGNTMLQGIRKSWSQVIFLGNSEGSFQLTIIPGKLMSQITTFDQDN